MSKLGQSAKNAEFKATKENDKKRKKNLNRTWIKERMNIFTYEGYPSFCHELALYMSSLSRAHLIWYVQKVSSAIAFLMFISAYISFFVSPLRAPKGWLFFMLYLLYCGLGIRKCYPHDMSYKFLQPQELKVFQCIWRACMRTI